jgi:hypothetical protein
VSPRRAWIKEGRLMRSQAQRGLTYVVITRGTGPHPETGVIGDYVSYRIDTRWPVKDVHKAEEP